MKSSNSVKCIVNKCSVNFFEDSKILYFHFQINAELFPPVSANESDVYAGKILLFEHTELQMSAWIYTENHSLNVCEIA
jgi:hypothetical protein